VTPLKNIIKRDSNIFSPDLRSIKLFENKTDDQNMSNVVLSNSKANNIGQSSTFDVSS